MKNKDYRHDAEYRLAQQDPAWANWEAGLFGDPVFDGMVRREVVRYGKAAVTNGVLIEDLKQRIVNRCIRRRARDYVATYDPVWLCFSDLEIRHTIWNFFNGSRLKAGLAMHGFPVDRLERDDECELSRELRDRPDWIAMERDARRQWEAAKETLTAEDRRIVEILETGVPRTVSDKLRAAARKLAQYAPIAELLKAFNERFALPVQTV